MTNIIDPALQQDLRDALDDHLLTVSDVERANRQPDPVAAAERLLCHAHGEDLAPFAAEATP